MSGPHKCTIRGQTNGLQLYTSRMVQLKIPAAPSDPNRRQNSHAYACCPCGCYVNHTLLSWPKQLQKTTLHQDPQGCTVYHGHTLHCTGACCRCLNPLSTNFHPAASNCPDKSMRTTQTVYAIPQKHIAHTYTRHQRLLHNNRQNIQPHPTPQYS